MSTLFINVSQVVYYQTQMSDFGAIFVRKNQPDNHYKSQSLSKKLGYTVRD